MEKKKGGKEEEREERKEGKKEGNRLPQNFKENDVQDTETSSSWPVSPPTLSASHLEIQIQKVYTTLKT